MTGLVGPFVLSLLTTTAIFAQNTHLLLREAMKLENEGKVEAAIDIYEKLLGRNHRNVSAIYRLGSAYQKLARYDDAIRVLRTRLERAPGDVTALNRLSDVYFASGSEVESDRVIERILKVGGNQGTYTAVGQRYERRNQDDKAIPVYLRGREIFEDPELFSRELAQIYERAERYVDAVREYGTLARQKPQYVSLVESKLRTIATATPEPAPLFALLLEGVKAGYRDSRITRLFVTFSIAADMTGQALAELMLLPPEARIDGGLLRLGREALDYGNPADAKLAFETLAGRTRNRTIVTQASVAIARALDKLGRNDEAIALYRSVVGRRSNIPAHEESAYRLGELLWRTDQTDSAVATLDDFVGWDGKSEWRIRALELLGDIHLAHDRYSEAARAYGRNVEENHGQEAALSATYKLAHLYTIERRYAAAQKALTSVLNSSAVSLVYNDALELSDLVDTGILEDPAGLDTAAKALRLQAADRRLDAAETYLGARTRPGAALSPKLIRLAIELLVDQEAWVRAEEALKALITSHQTSTAWTKFALGRVLEEQDRADEAVRLYEQILVDYPTSLEADRSRERLTDLRPENRRNEEAG